MKRQSRVRLGSWAIGVGLGLGIAACSSEPLDTRDTPRSPVEPPAARAERATKALRNAFPDAGVDAPGNGIARVYGKGLSSGKTAALDCGIYLFPGLLMLISGGKIIFRHSARKANQ